MRSSKLFKIILSFIVIALLFFVVPSAVSARGADETYADISVEKIEAAPVLLTEYTSGSLVASGNGNVTINGKGLYIVETGSEVHKILIK